MNKADKATLERVERANAKTVVGSGMRPTDRRAVMQEMQVDWEIKCTQKNKQAYYSNANFLRNFFTRSSVSLN